MNSLVWLQFGMAFAIGGYISNRLTVGYYKRKIRKINLENNLINYGQKTTVAGKAN